MTELIEPESILNHPKRKKKGDPDRIIDLVKLGEVEFNRVYDHAKKNSNPYSDVIKFRYTDQLFKTLKILCWIAENDYYLFLEFFITDKKKVHKDRLDVLQNLKKILNLTDVIGMTELNELSEKTPEGIEIPRKLKEILEKYELLEDLEEINYFGRGK